MAEFGKNEEEFDLDALPPLEDSSSDDDDSDDESSSDDEDGAATVPVPASPEDVETDAYTPQLPPKSAQPEGDDAEALMSMMQGMGAEERPEGGASTAITRVVTAEEKAEAQEWKAKGTAAFKGKRWNESKVAYSRAHDIDPTDVPILSNVVAALLKIGDNVDALTFANRLCKLDPNFPKGWFRKASAQLALGKPKAAAKSLQKAFLLDPGNPDKVIHMMLMQTDPKYQKAIEALDEHKKKNEGYRETLRQMFHPASQHSLNFPFLKMWTHEWYPEDREKCMVAAVQNVLQRTEDDSRHGGRCKALHKAGGKLTGNIGTRMAVLKKSTEETYAQTITVISCCLEDLLVENMFNDYDCLPKFLDLVMEDTEHTRNIGHDAGLVLEAFRWDVVMGHPLERILTRRMAKQMRTRACVDFAVTCIKSTAEIILSRQQKKWQREKDAAKFADPDALDKWHKFT
jgi:tetratricopeptide (TPR) repeat protein